MESAKFLTKKEYFKTSASDEFTKSIRSTASACYVLIMINVALRLFGLCDYFTHLWCDKSYFYGNNVWKAGWLDVACSSIVFYESICG